MPINMNRKTKREIAVALKGLAMVFVIIILVTAAIRIKFEKEYMPYPDSLSLLPVNDYALDHFYQDENGLLSYEDDNYYSMAGIDVSEHQGVIDWQKVKEAGIEFAYLRAGFRGYSIGGLHEDHCFYDNYKGAKENGIKVGVYFFSQAINEEEAREEAEFVHQMIKDLEIDLEVVYDYEMPEESRIRNLEKSQYTLNALSFATAIMTYGYKPMIYANLDWIYHVYDMSKILNYDLWYAQYYQEPEVVYAYKIWQYSENGHLDGINEDVDLNVRFIPKHMNDQSQ